MSLCTTMKLAQWCASDVRGLKLMFWPQLPDRFIAVSNWKITSWPLESMQRFCFVFWMNESCLLWNQISPRYPKVKQTVFLNNSLGLSRFYQVQLWLTFQSKLSKCRNHITALRFFGVPQFTLHNVLFLDFVLFILTPPPIPFPYWLAAICWSCFISQSKEQLRSFKYTQVPLASVGKHRHWGGIKTNKLSAVVFSS